MSSIHHLGRRPARAAAALVLGLLVGIAAPGQCQAIPGEDGSTWDRARAALLASQPGTIGPAIQRWRQLDASDGFGFDDYAGFLLAYPGFPESWKLRLAAERALAFTPVDSGRLVAFFDRYPPLTNPARAQYALALAAVGRSEATEVARMAWRGGSMSDTAEAAIAARYSTRFGVTDHDARLDALLWDGNSAMAARALGMGRASPGARRIAQARLSLQQGLDPEAPAPAYSAPSPYAGSAPMGQASADGSFAVVEPTPGSAAPPPTYPAPAPLPTVQPLGRPVDVALLRADPGYLYDRARLLIRRGATSSAVSLMANHGALARPALDPRKWVALLLSLARSADAASATRIALGAEAGFAAGADVSAFDYPIRNDYTSLTWAGATAALWQTANAADAATLFYRYGTAARTPQTRSKGFYWAGRAVAREGEKATRYFTSAAAYPDQYYGMLALERLARPLPPLTEAAPPTPSPDQRAAFYARPITQAVREMARDGDWGTTIKFFREIADQVNSAADAALVADLARSLGRRDLSVILGQAASNKNIAGFRAISFPLVPVPADASWTMVHAIIRQESQFSHNAVSRAGARGLMQLMPAVAAEQARKSGVGYSPAMIADPALNIRLGDALFSHLMTLYNGSYPLAIAAYNAGPGNVNRWLASNGDPRNGGVGWVDWVERIPLTETRGYVAHVIENAVVYDALNPDRASFRGPNPASHFIGKQAPG